jgi:hypothetical protein
VGILRYATVLDYERHNVLAKGMIQMLNLKLDAIERAERQPPQAFRIIGGFLEKITDSPKHPSRSAQIWNNAYYSKSRRKSVSYRRMSAAGNSPLSFAPHILDDVLEYVWLPKDVKLAYRQLIEDKNKEDHAKTQ